MRFRRSLALVAVVSLLAAACGSSASPSPTVAPTEAASSGPTAAPTPTPNPLAGKTIKVVKAGDHAFDDVSIGHWINLMKTNYDVTIDFNATDTADTSLRAVVSGAADMAVAMSLTGVVNLVQATNTDVKLLAADTYASDYQIVSKSDVTLDNLGGKTEGISAPGDASELVSHLCLNGQGFHYSSLKIVRIGGTSARVAALIAGQIDIGAAHISDAKAAVAKANGALKILLDCGKVVGNYPVTGMTVTGAGLAANPDLAQAAVNAYIDSMRWAANNKDQYIAEAAVWVPDSDPPNPRTRTILQVRRLLAPERRHRPELARDLPGLRGPARRPHREIPTTDKWVNDSFVTTYLAANGTK